MIPADPRAAVTIGEVVKLMVVNGLYLEAAITSSPSQEGESRTYSMKDLID